MPLPSLARYDDELRRRLPPPPGLRREDDGPLTRIVGPTSHPLDHMVCHSRLMARDADDVARVEVERARRERHGLQWNVYDHDEPPDLVHRLERLGLSRQNREAVVVMDADDDRLLASRPGVSVRRVLRDDALGDFFAVQEAVWGTAYSEWTRRWFRPALAGDADPVGIFVVYVGEQPAGSAWVALPHDRSFALMFGGTVLESHRGRGVYRALVDARARAAREHGARWLVADANDRSAPILGAIGFARIAWRTEMSLAEPTAGGTSAQVATTKSNEAALPPGTSTTRMRSQVE